MTCRCRVSRACRLLMTICTLDPEPMAQPFDADLRCGWGLVWPCGVWQVVKLRNCV